MIEGASRPFSKMTKPPLNAVEMHVPAKRAPGILFLFHGDKLVFIHACGEPATRLANLAIFGPTKFDRAFVVDIDADCYATESALLRAFNPPGNLAAGDPRGTKPQLAGDFDLLQPFRFADGCEDLF